MQVAGDSSFKNIVRTRQVVPSLEPQGADLLAQMLRYEPARRVTAKAALQHPYFRDLPQLLSQHIPLM